MNGKYHNLVRPVMQSTSWIEQLGTGFRWPLLLWYGLLVGTGTLMMSSLLRTQQSGVVFTIAALCWTLLFLWVFRISKGAAIGYLLLTALWIAWGIVYGIDWLRL